MQQDHHIEKYCLSNRHDCLTETFRTQQNQNFHSFLLAAWQILFCRKRHNMLSFWQINFGDWVKVISWFSGQWNLHLAPKLQFILAVLWDFMATRVRANVSRINYFLEVPCLIVTFTVCCNLNRNWFLEWAGSRQSGSCDHQWLWYENQIFINLHLFLKYW